MDNSFTDRQLIFLASQPRAGSTLLQSILAGAAGVHTTAEPWLMLHPLYALRATGHTADYDATIANRALQDFLAGLTGGESAYLSALRTFALELYGRASAAAGKTIFLDKTPRYYLVLPELAQTFPSASIIIILRNPAAVLSSILRTWVNGNWARFAYFRDDLLTAPRLLAEFIAGYNDRAIIVHYESLIRSPEVSVRALCEKLELIFQPEMLRYGDRPPPLGRYGDPSGIGRHSQPSETGLDAWLEHATDPQIHHLLLAYLHALGSDLLDRLGYDFSELIAAMNTVAVRPGKPAVTWEQLLKIDQTFSDKLALVLTEGWRERRPGHTARQIGRLLTNRL